MPTNQTQVIIPAGRLGMDPVDHEINGVPGALTRFSLAIDDDYRQGDGSWVEQTVWMEIQTWNALAERVRTLGIRKGDLISVTGKLKQSTIVDEQGKNRTFTKVWADRVMLLARKGEKRGSKNAAAPTQEQAASAEADVAPIENGDVPF